MEKEKMKKAMKEKLYEWANPNVGESQVLQFVTSDDKMSGYALVEYERKVEIDYLFYSVFADRAEISCDKRIDLPQDEIERKLVLSAVEETFQTFAHRFR